MDKTEEEIETFAGLDFDQIFRVKGKQGLFTIRSHVNKAGLIGVSGFLERDIKHTVKAMDLECLGSLVFKTTDVEYNDKNEVAGMKQINISDVFTNMNEYQSKTEDHTFSKLKSNKEIMAVMVHNYDANEFKEYHAIKVMKWYIDIIGRLNSVSKDEVVGRTIVNMKEMNKDKKTQAVVADHHICYGTDIPLCGILPIGVRGLIDDNKLITCPECKMKMVSNPIIKTE